MFLANRTASAKALRWEWACWLKEQKKEQRKRSAVNTGVLGLWSGQVSRDLSTLSLGALGEGRQRTEPVMGHSPTPAAVVLKLESWLKCTSVGPLAWPGLCFYIAWRKNHPDPHKNSEEILVWMKQDAILCWWHWNGCDRQFSARDLTEDEEFFLSHLEEGRLPFSVSFQSLLSVKQPETAEGSRGPLT